MRDPLAPTIAYKCTRRECARLNVIPPLEEDQPNPVCPFCGHAVTIYQRLSPPRRRND